MRLTKSLELLAAPPPPIAWSLSMLSSKRIEISDAISMKWRMDGG